jgi:hypothetical protein
MEECYGEELDGHLDRPQWLTIREQTFTGREHRPPAVSAEHLCAVHHHPSPVTIIRHHVFP